MRKLKIPTQIEKYVKMLSNEEKHILSQKMIEYKQLLKDQKIFNQQQKNK